MIGFTNLGFCLLVSFSVSLLCLTIYLLYCLCHVRRRREQSIGCDTELGGKVSFFKLPVFHFLCRRIQSRVEPAGESPVLSSSGVDQVKITLPEAEDEECVLVRWRSEAFGRSRELYTIREEEKEGVESDGERASGIGGSDRSGWVETVEEEEDVLFSTPCLSPIFYTPASSPTRTPEWEPIMALSV